SCPCALVISIPLGYFGGIGAGSRNGILFKGANFLDLLTRVDTVVMDKTGTLTKGLFEVQDIVTEDYNKEKLIKIAAVLESKSSHPIAKAITEYANIVHTFYKAHGVTEISGYGIKGNVNKYEVIAGNAKMLDKYNIDFDDNLRKIEDTTVLVAINKKYVGHIIIADNLKTDAEDAINSLKKIKKIKNIVMLSGDKQPVVTKMAKKLNIVVAKGGLLPEDKINEVEKYKKQGKTVVFIGDGINDAPVITMADVGMAMGGLGSDAAIETADVIIQNDQPSKIATAIHISNATKKIIWQNIIFALSVKAVVLVLGAFGLATMWEAVIADVGVALIAIFNAVRIQRMTF
ncbi:MAG: heavy metal translocating P-type ATPase, partial [Bacteroidetes bacterium]